MTNDRKQPSALTLSAKDLETLGINQVAFIKTVTEDGDERFVVHAADGTAVRVFPTRELAELAIRQNDLQPLSVH